MKIAKEETAQKMVIVAKEKESADVLKEAIAKEEAIVTAAVDEANAIKNECDEDLNKALPTLYAA